MFIAYVGKPGGGKSYDAVRKIIDNLKMGRVVATNIDGMQESKHQEAMKQLSGLDDFQFHRQFIFLQKDDITSFWVPRERDAEDLGMKVPLVPPGSLVVLDEVHKWINSREWASGQNKVFAEWGAEHRHEGYDVILITQDITKIDKQVRSLVEFTYFYRKINFFGNLVKKRYLKYPYDGDDHEGKSSVSPTTHSYDKRFFRCYRSYKLPGVVEKDFQAHINVLKHPVFYALPLVIGYAIYSLCHSGLIHGDLFGTKGQIARAVKLGESNANAATIPKSKQFPVTPVAPVAVPVTNAPVGTKTMEFMKNYSTVGGRPNGQTNLHVTDKVMVKGYVKDDDLYHVYLSDGSFVTMRKKPQVNSIYND